MTYSEKIAEYCLNCGFYIDRLCAGEKKGQAQDCKSAKDTKNNGS